MRRDRRAVLVSVVGITAAIGLMVFAGYRVFESISTQVRRGSGRVEVHVAGSRSEPVVSSEAELGEFDEISIVGGWNVTVRHGDSYSVNYRASGRAADLVRVTTRGDQLRLELAPGSAIINANLSAEIITPELSHLQIDGGASVTLSGIQTAALRIDVDGAASITGEECDIEELDLETDGASQVDFSRSSVVDAEIRMDGASSLSINMDGGELVGEIRGLGEVRYSGEVQRQAVDIDGIGRIHRVD